MKSIKLAAVALMTGLAFAEVNHPRRFVSEVDCESTCTTDHDKSEPVLKINPFTANQDYPEEDRLVVVHPSAESNTGVVGPDALRRILLQSNDDADTIETPSSIGNENELFERSAQLPSLFCSGKDLKKKDIAGICMDGNFLWYTSDDCSKKCKCDETGSISCDIPSDCGPQKDVVEYCISNPSFSCTCLADPGNVHAVQKQQRDITQVSEPAVEVHDVDVDPTPVIVVPSEKEQAQDMGVPNPEPCFIYWDCWKPNHTNGVRHVATTLATVTTMLVR